MYKNEKNNSPSRPQRVLVEQKSGTTVAVSTPSWLSLAKKAGKSNFPLSVVEQVYCRGIMSAKYHPKNTLEQQAFNRVDSFLHEGKAFELDHDLLVETPKVPNGSKHMSIIKAAIKGHEERNEPQQTNDSQQVNEDLGTFVGRKLHRAIFGGRKKSKFDPETHKKERIERRWADFEADQEIEKRKQEYFAKSEKNRASKQSTPTSKPKGIVSRIKNVLGVKEKDRTHPWGPDKSEPRPVTSVPSAGSRIKLRSQPFNPEAHAAAREVLRRTGTAIRARDEAYRLARFKGYQHEKRLQQNKPKISSTSTDTNSGWEPNPNKRIEASKKEFQSSMEAGRRKGATYAGDPVKKKRKRTGHVPGGGIG